MWYPVGTPARSVQRTLRLDLDAAASVDDLSGVHQVIAFAELIILHVG